MKHWLQKRNTLRNQLLFVYFVVMLIVLTVVSTITYILVSDMLQDNAEEQMRQTAMESSARYDSLFEQLNMMTKQVITSEELQNILLQEKKEHPATFEQRQSLMSTVNRIQANADGIYSVEIYTADYQRLIPIDSTNLNTRIDPSWVQKANQAKGQLVWMGEDPLDPNFFLIGRRINLMDRHFQLGGYIVTRINRNYFQLNPNQQRQQMNEYTILMDNENRVIASNYQGDQMKKILNTNSQTITIDEKEYMLVENRSTITGWSLYMLTPVNQLTGGMTAVQAWIIIAGMIGLFIFLISSFFLSTYISKPIAKLTETMRQASEGVLAQNPMTHSTVEINELNQTYNQLASETNYLVQMVYEKELMKHRTELKALQAQIHPHFLFNTLDALYWSLDDRDQEDLANIVLAMSALFRYTITRENQDEWVTMEDELDHIDRYMQIMRMRFGERLSWTKDIHTKWYSVRIPKLMIQPLVENAILHGASNVSGMCHVTVQVEADEERHLLQIRVIDNGAGMTEETTDKVLNQIDTGHSSKKAGGMALHNIEKRLQLFYGERNHLGLRIKSKRGEGTVVSFAIPIEEGEK
ncbi:two-component system sensor histidine kinase [Gracilibacillus halophilus YIM-C55.5]|uniref:histidine kinase n=1 Tax=Gracilibacillus halophilus YIM-C55.5 TaxID=1308866 RepID=N4WTQ4_9BACI|nr:sensor histidine kinase [Gracilibacillus halophilus]ENH97740.1 two-component system sensor histidine kinase [Gracilibacillus halophilus YIM-C55.5]